MSDTPRTDAVLDKGKLEPITSRAFSLADHSRRLERELAEARKCQGCGSDLVCANADCRNYIAVEVLADEEELASRISVAVAEMRKALKRPEVEGAM